MSVKNKTLLFISAVFILFAFIFLNIIVKKQEDVLHNKELAYYNNVKHLYSKVREKYEKFYTNRILANINSKGVKEAMFARDKELLYSLSKHRWEVLKKENKDLTIMDFHLPDGSVFLSMQNPNRDVKLMDKSVMLSQLRIDKKALYGFESSSGEFFYRIFQPIIFQDKYIGSVEFGLRPNYLLNEMNYYNDMDGALFVKEGKNTLLNDAQNIKIKDYVLEYNLLSDMRIFDYLPKNYNFDSLINVNLPNDLVYGVYSFEIKDFSGNAVTKVMFFKDISDDVATFRKNTRDLALLLIISIVILIAIINLGLNKMIVSLENRYHDAKEYKEMIDNNLMTLYCGLDNVIYYASDTFCKVSGFEKEELLGEKVNRYIDKQMQEDYNTKIKKSLKNGSAFSKELKCWNKQGEAYWVSLNVQPKLKDDNIVGYDVVMHDVTDKKNNEELMITDGLTHIYNRRYFNEIFPRMIQQIKREGGYLSLIILDVDHFKQYNDFYGHQAGDEALIAVAKALKNTLNRGNDYCFRLGGEEFGVVFKSANEDEAYLFAQKLRRNVMALEIEHIHNENGKTLTASFGLVTLASDCLVSEKEMYKTADEHLYLAKESGRNRVISKSV